MNLSLKDRVVLDPGSGQLFDSRSWRRLQPPKGQKYHPEITRFAPDGRFVLMRNNVLDTKTEKTFAAFALHRLPPPDRLKIPPDLLELWAQVAVRGQLDDEGAFLKWDEPTWEKKRQELAAKPAPIPDFPFPGHVALDRLHWLRAEFENADEQNKPQLAKQLLDRAQAAGDNAQAARWRRWLAPKAKPPAAPASK